jgi:hypothetical protein
MTFNAGDGNDSSVDRSAPSNEAGADSAYRHPKVTIREKPSKQLVREAQKETVVTDARGRRIRLSKPPVLAEYKLTLLVGPEAAANRTYIHMIYPLLYVTAIDDDPVFFPAKAIEIDALIQRLDEDGVTAVVKSVDEQLAREERELERDDIKN